LPFVFVDIFELDNIIYAVRQDVDGEENGLYKLVAGAWVLAFNHNNIKKIFKMVNGTYFIISDSITGVMFKISLNEPINNKTGVLTALGTAGDIIDIVEHSSGNKIWILYSKKAFVSSMGQGA
jgi:hypothetical protein